jgi:hypothetical protein
MRAAVLRSLKLLVDKMDSLCYDVRDMMMPLREGSVEEADGKRHHLDS